MGCCDCGLVHELQFFAISTSRVLFRARRSKGATKRLRQLMGRKRALTKKG